MTETDQELLKLAAKSYGPVIEWDGDGWVITSKVKGHLTNYEAWNPLTDDGDALRLAVTLEITPGKHDDTVVASRSAIWRNGAAHCSLWEPAGDDPYAATRRAIVRAAAEIGRSMP